MSARFIERTLLLSALYIERTLYWAHALLSAGFIERTLYWAHAFWKFPLVLKKLRFFWRFWNFVNLALVAFLIFCLSLCVKSVKQLLLCLWEEDEGENRIWIMVELQRQLELKDTTIASLRRVIEQKDELLAATEEKLKALEEKRDEIEEALISLTIDANDNPEEDEIGNVQFLIIF